MLACLYRNPFGRLFPFSLSISCVVFLSVVSILPLTSSQVFSLIQPFWLLFVSFSFPLFVVFTVFVFSFCLPGPSCVTFYRHYYGFFPLFVVHLCEVCVSFSI